MKLIHTHDHDSRYIPAMPFIEIGVARSIGQELIPLTAIVDSGADAEIPGVVHSGLLYLS